MAKIVGIKEYHKTVEHHEKMLEWAKTQSPLSMVSLRVMQGFIGETWMGGSCYLCEQYFEYTGDSTVIEDCTLCPLALNGMFCCVIESPWQELNSATTWAEWIEAEEAFLKAFKALPVRKSRSKK